MRMKILLVLLVDAMWESVNAACKQQNLWNILWLTSVINLFTLSDHLFTDDLILSGAVGQGSSISAEGNFDGKENTEVRTTNILYSTIVPV